MIRYVFLGLIALAFNAQAQYLIVSVEPGEQLGTLAQRYLVAPASLHWREVAKVNGLHEPYIIRPGDQIKLPLRLMASLPSQARWLAVSGGVIVKSQHASVTAQAKAGDMLNEGDRVMLDASASGLLLLGDGSQVKLLPNTIFVLEEHRYNNGRQGPITGTKGFSGLLRLIQGSIETRATSASDRAKALRVVTPTSVVGVRGTEFRVTHDALELGQKIAPASSTNQTRAEVLEGLVQARLDERRKTEVAKDFGVRLDPTNPQMPAAVPLLEAPSLQAWRLEHDRPIIELTALPTEQAGKKIQGYRVQIAPVVARNMDAGAAAADSFQNIVYDKRFASNQAIRILDLPDGAWRLRVRGIDESGIEGKNAYATAVLKARPEPPVIQDAKPSQTVIYTEVVNIFWAKAVGAVGYLLEVVDERGQRTEYRLQQTSAALKGLAPSTYQWRMATQVIDKDGKLDTGPWSDPQTFKLLPVPAPAKAEMDEKEKTLALRWSDQKAVGYEVQVSRTGKFEGAAPALVIYKTTQPELLLSNPESGEYFIRYQPIEVDGQRGSWSGTMQVTVPIDWRHLLLYLGGSLTKWP